MSTAWTAPKLNWKATDSFEVDDYTRIKQNAQYLSQLLVKLRGSAPSISLYNPTQAFIPTSVFYNDTEKAAADIRNAALAGGAAPKTYTAYAKAWSAEDLNRIENLQSVSSGILTAESSALNVLAYTLCAKGGYF
ncbi:MAG: hypothetical protein EOM30_01040 [Clostridia bacterium]|nr:hypothetical protein [Clostridia bacterium]NLS85357.1 hypothetical protein [Oscillospiraceae bacterium]